MKNMQRPRGKGRRRVFNNEYYRPRDSFPTVKKVKPVKEQERTPEQDGLAYLMNKYGL